MKYIRPFDGFRALAVAFVVFEHWLPPGNALKFLPMGYIGVTMFYVLSGFLITSILFESRHLIEEGKVTAGFAFKTFYARRTLRIFPVYYLLLTLLYFFYPVVFNFDRGCLPSLFTYTTNIYMYINKHWLGSLSPLWSLAVEEQFYLFWPLLIIFTGKKHHLRWITMVGIGAVIFRIVCSVTPVLSREGYYEVLTPACFDSFAAGALLSYFYTRSTHYDKFIKVITPLAALSLVAFIVTLKFFNEYYQVLYRLPISIMSLWLLAVLLNKENKLTRYIFSNSALTYIGKISYGIYLVHNFVPQIYMESSKYMQMHGYLIPFTKYAWLPFVGGAKQKVFYIFALLGITSLSWFCFEKPINNLKRHFNYSRQ